MKYEKNNRGFDQQAEITRCQVGPERISGYNFE